MLNDTPTRPTMKVKKRTVVQFLEVLERKPFPSPGDLPNPGTEPRYPALQVYSLPAEPPEKPKNTGVGSLSLL